MVCPQCGNFLEEHNNFCEHCQQFVRPITQEAYQAQQDSKELKELPKDSEQMSGSAADILLSSLKEPKNKPLVIILAVALTICVLLSFFSVKLYFQKTSIVPNTNVSTSDTTTVIHKLNLQQIGADGYGYTTVPDTWINAVYDSTLGDDLPSIQYVSIDGKYSVTLSKASASSATLNSCAINLQKMLIDYFNIEENDEKKIVKVDKSSVNDISAFCVHGIYKIEGKPTCSISSYLLMDDNDNLYMITLASYDTSFDMSFALKNFSFSKPEEKEKTESEDELNLW